MQSPPADATHRFLYAFWGVKQRFVRGAVPVLKVRHGLEMGDYVLLDHVARSDLSPTELARALALPAHTVSRRLDAMEKRGLLRRTLDPDDARRRVLTLTPSGRAVLGDAGRTLRQETATFLSALEPTALDAFLGALETLAKEPTP